jgi:ABC-type sugar transport system ATPase subunit
VSSLREKIEPDIEDKRLILGIRPQDVLLEHTQTTGEVSNPISVIVEMVQPMARKKIIDLQMEGAKIKMVVPGTYHVTSGERLQVMFDLKRLHLFVPDTSKAIV